MLAFGSCVMAMHMARWPQLQAYPSPVGVQPRTRVEVCMQLGDWLHRPDGDSLHWDVGPASQPHQPGARSVAPVAREQVYTEAYYMESPSEDYSQTSERPLDAIQPLRRTWPSAPQPLRKAWPSARKMGSKMMGQKLHHHEKEHESEPDPPGWSYHDATPAEAGGRLLSLAAKRKVFWASQLRKPTS